MKRNIRPADEEFDNCTLPLVFSVLWYAAIGKQLTLSLAPTLLLFAAAGILLKLFL